jgi:folate-binding protein YgfZ
MNALELHDFHNRLGASFCAVNECEAVTDYGDALAEHTALLEKAGVLDLSSRGRLCLTGNDRIRFLHGQVTNDIKSLLPNTGCYAVLVTAKGRIQSDLNVYNLGDELLLDLEPGLTTTVSQRLENFIVADDVQVVDVASLYGLLSVQGPGARKVINALALFADMPGERFSVASVKDATLGEVYLINQPRLASIGYDVLVPVGCLSAVFDRMIAGAKSIGGRACGWSALETVRVEAGIPRFGVDMDETNFPQESGIESRAVSFTKGCYIGQEVLNRVHTMGHVNRHLQGLRLRGPLKSLPMKGDKLFHNGREAGNITSAIFSPALGANIALGYVAKQANQLGTELRMRSAGVETPVEIVELPFRK